MSIAQLSRILPLVPARSARRASGSAFAPEGAACAHPARLAQLSGLLGWLTPLNRTDLEAQRVFGLINAAGRPVHAADAELDDAEEEAGAAIGEAEDAVA